uniref:DM domain-containing protein n=2 Tax=Caenorhabditis japonica TaxID=281687 RepID=A0A8R1HP96_CAEJA
MNATVSPAALLLRAHRREKRLFVCLCPQKKEHKKSRKEELMLTEDSTPEMCEALIAEQEKNYYCQRCLNHGELNPRKGHKPDCGYLKCPCAECTMVEQRRQLNNLLSKKKVHITPATATKNGKRVRDPHCARCSAHGVLVPLRGHKRTMCQFVTCTCTLCELVEHRRMLMAAQIKLRRLQQKTRDGKEPVKRSGGRKSKNAVEDMEPATVAVQVAEKRADSASPYSSSSSSSSPSTTMSPSLSISPPPTPPPAPLLAPVPVYPSALQMLQHQQQSAQSLFSCLMMNLNCSPIGAIPIEGPHTLTGGGAPPVFSPNSAFTPLVLNEQLGAALATMYLKGLVKIDTRRVP